jgi:hypothetical protein
MKGDGNLAQNLGLHEASSDGSGSSQRPQQDGRNFGYDRGTASSVY